MTICSLLLMLCAVAMYFRYVNYVGVQRSSLMSHYDSLAKSLTQRCVHYKQHYSIICGPASQTVKRHLIRTTFVQIHFLQYPQWETNYQISPSIELRGIFYPFVIPTLYIPYLQLGKYIFKNFNPWCTLDMLIKFFF